MPIFSTTILKLVRKVLHLTGRGRGTALPGLWGEKYFYKSLSTLPQQLEKIIIITGTNGKTTTSKIIRSILKQNKVSVLSNISGANLTRGILSALAFDTNFFGKIKSKVAVFEVEEASMAKTVELLNPDIAIVTNLFRDQMDAYGELDHTREVIEKGLEKMKEDSVVLLNGNDPKVLYMSRVCKGQVKYYGLDDTNIPTDEENAVPDSFKSPDDRSQLQYSKIYFSHLGIFKSTDGTFRTPELDYKATNYEIKVVDNELKTTSTNFLLFDAKSKKGLKVNEFKLLGIYNIINCISAYAVLQNLHIKGVDEIKQDYSLVSAAFGRGEKIKIRIGTDNYVTLLLVKNPTGFNSALGAINEIPQKSILFGLNDNTADGKDVSWIWDCNFEALKNYRKVIVVGQRSTDLALRCKYAEIPSVLVDNYESAIREFIEYKDSDGYMKERKNTHIYALCSYTALLRLREYLANIADLKPIEQEL